MLTAGVVPIKVGAPGRNRTCDRPLRRRLLYSAELRGPAVTVVKRRDRDVPYATRSWPKSF